MRQIKIIHHQSLPEGVQTIENEINEFLREVDKNKGTVKNITYNATDCIGQVHAAIIEYDI